MMFVSTASGFCDETKDALEPSVSHLQVTGKIQETSTKNVSLECCPGINLKNARETLGQDILSLLQLAEKCLTFVELYNKIHCHGFLVYIVLIILLTSILIGSSDNDTDEATSI